MGVQDAWEVLRCPGSRAAYDREIDVSAHLGAAVWPRYSAPSASKPTPGSAAKTTSSEWYKEWAAHQAAESIKNRQQAGQRRRDPFESSRVEQVRMTTQHFEEVLKEVKSDPELRRFVGGGMQVKLMCQLALILATLMNLALFAWAKGQRNTGASNAVKRSPSFENSFRLSRWF